MPILDQRKRLLAIEAGIDPDEASEVSFAPEVEQEPKALHSTPTMEQVSPSAAFGQEFGRNALPAVGGLAVGAKTMAATAPFIGPWSIPVGIGAGIGTSILGRMGQDKAVDLTLPEGWSEAYRESEARNYKQHPIASALGSAGANLIAMKPDPKSVVTAGKGLIKPLRGGLMTAAEKNAIANVGLGATIPAASTYGAEAYRQGDLTPEIDPTRLAIDVIAGGLINNPNRIGRKLGLTPNTYDETPMSGIREKHKKSKPLPRVEDPDEKLYQAELEQTPYYQELRRRQAEVEAKKAEAEALKKARENEIALAKAEKEADALYKAELESTEEFKAATAKKQQAAAAKENKEIAKAQKFEEFKAKKKDQRLVKEGVEDLQYDPPVMKVEGDNIPKPRVETEMGKEIYPDYTGNQEIDAELMAKAPETEAERIQDEYDRGVRKQEKSRLQEGTKKQGIPARISEAWKQALTKLGVMRNVELKTEFVKDKGEEIAGQSDLREGLKKVVARINPNLAKVDSMPHELLHPFIEDLRVNGTDSDKALVKNFEKSVSESPDFTSWQKSLGEKSSYKLTDEFTLADQVDEFMATKGGEDFVRRHLGTDKKGAIGNALSDVWSNIKTKFGKATDDDYARILSYRLTSDPTFNERFGGAKAQPKVTGAETKNQEESRLKPIKAKFRGEFENPRTGQKLRQYDLEEPIINKDGEEIHPAGSTVSEGRFTENGYEIPPRTKNQDASRLNEGDEFLEVPKPKKGTVFEDYSFDKLREGKKLGKDFVEDLEKFAGSKMPPEVRNWLFKADSEEARGALQDMGFDEDVVNTAVEKKDAALDSTKKSLEAAKTEGMLSRPELLVKNQERSRLAEKSNLVDDESKAKAAESPVDIDTLPKSQYDISRLPGFNIIRSSVDKVSDEFPELGKGLKKFYDQQKNLTGKLLNPFANAVREQMDIDSVAGVFKNAKAYLYQDSPELQNVRDYLWAHNDGEKLPELGEKEQAILKAWQDAYKGVKAEHRARMEGEGKLRDIKNEVDDPLYFPHRAKLEIVKQLTQHPTSERSQALRKEFIEYQKSKGADEKKANDNYAEFIKGFNKKDLELASQYGPIDRSEDYGLPRSWRDESFLNTAQHYLDRVVRRFAYNDAIQRSGLSKDWETALSNDQFKPIARDIQGSATLDNPLAMQIAGIARAGMLGTLTGAKDFASALTLGWQHQQNLPSALKASLEGIKNLKENIADASEYGRIRPHMNVLEWDGGYNDGIMALRRFRDVVSDATGRNFLDQAARGMAMGQGKWATLNYHEQYQAGELSKQGQKFFDDFAQGIDWKKAELSPEDVKQIAARYVDSSQGAYNYTGLPAWTMEGQLAPFFSLSRWSVEKSNNYIKNVVNPAINDGNWKPFLMSTLGMVAGGTLVNELVEKVTGRKQKTATFAELEDARKRGKDTKMATAYKMMGLATSAGHVGFVGDILKSVLDVTYGRNRPQIYNNVMLELAENTATTIGNLGKSIMDNGFEPEVVMDSLAQLLEDNLQTWRIIESQLSAETKKDIEQANKLRDLRVFNTLEGNAIRDLSSPFSRPPLDPKMKKFKRAETYEEAAQVLPELLTRALKRADGNVEKLTRELSRIKRNSYQTMPNPDRWPLSAREYYLSLARTQGPKAAVERMQDYIRRNQINKAKAEMVPDVN